jgi:zinc protease
LVHRMQFRGSVIAGLLAMVFASGLSVSAQHPAKSETPVVIVTLKNGLCVLLWPDHRIPVIATAVFYNVGSRNEKEGKTGYAHLFEHMMFQGSGNVGRGEHMALIEENGGGMNGTTDKEITRYYEQLPANQLNLALFLESDRMRGLALTQESLDNQRSTVKEERRLRVDNAPYGTTNLAIDNLVHDSFAYKHSIIGSMEDLNAASLNDISEFFRIYYAPNNAVLSIAGDFDEKTILAKVEKYFGAIPSQPAPPVPNIAEQPIVAERHLALTDNFAAQPEVNIVYKTVIGNTPDWFALYVASSILAGGESSRLYQRLVKEEQLAVSVSSDLDDGRTPGDFDISVVLRKSASMEAVEKAVADEIAKLQAGPVQPWEVEKVRNGATLQSAKIRQSAIALAYFMGQSQMLYHDPLAIIDRANYIKMVTGEQVSAAARKYLKPSGRVTIETQTKALTAQPNQIPSGAKQ